MFIFEALFCAVIGGVLLAARVARLYKEWPGHGEMRGSGLLPPNENLALRDDDIIER
jgi:hypothetical protein